MKLVNRLLLLMTILSVTTAIKAQDMLRTASGIQYKIVNAHPETPRIKVHDVIGFHYIMKTDKDSVLVSSYQSGKPTRTQVSDTKSIDDLMDVFVLLADKDSAVIKVPTDSMFKSNEQYRPAFFPKGSFLVFNIKIEKVQTLSEVFEEDNRKADSVKVLEKGIVDKYIASNNLTMLTTASGLKYSISKPSAKAKPIAGDTLFVNYTGRTLEGNVFDSSIEAEAKKAGLQGNGRVYEPISFVVGQGQVIPGWDEGMLLFNEGSAGKLLIPSDLAYGAQGAGGAIAPFSSLLFDIELVKVVHKAKPVVKPVAAPVKKPVAATSTVKKTTTTTTVKKPATTPAKPATTTAKPAVKKPAAATAPKK